MKAFEKQVSYSALNTYDTLNSLSGTTKNVWFVLHGLGYLSRYFLKYFNQLSPEENYIIAPQAPSKYYLGSQFKHVGASWLTKENTAMEIENVLNYLDAVYKSENIPDRCKLVVFGFSQGVSIAARWVAKSRISCNQLVFYAGGMPNELEKADFEFIHTSSCKVTVIVGKEDEFISAERLEKETERIEELFQGKAKQIVFDGGHEIKKEFIHQLLK